MKKKLTIGIVVAMLMICGVCACGSPQVQSSSEAPSAQSDASAAASDQPINWSPDTDCSMCHATEHSSLTDAAYLLANGHSDMQCTECHTDTGTLTDVHSKVTASDTKGAKRLKKTEVTKETCLSCHEADYTPEATASVTALTDSEGTTVNPHDLPTTSPDHATILCADCHTMHSTDTVEESAQSTCLGCHHQNVYECGTCHD